MNQQPYHIRLMRPDELQIAIDWAKEEGWDPGIHDAETFYVADPNGFFVGEIDHEIISTACVINYDKHSAFGGLYIVKKPFREMGYGMAMTQHCLKYAGDRNIGVDGVLENVSLYEQIGFHFYFKNIRFKHIVRNLSVDDSHLIALSNIPFEQILAYDNKCFFANRAPFLKKWITQQDATALGYVTGNQLKGYGVCRKCDEGYKIAPLFADNAQIAETLFLALQAKKDFILIDVPEINDIGMALAKKYNMLSVFATARMYNHYKPNIADHKIIAVTSFEIG